ncbi:PREDICTED: deoxynucleoside triphosphate triphosphohydrolase SAMHD1-like [Amphimedon queenslandica]|uniref:HD/PDEase domain-containing protein n=1 Tax=Amphimedon queenslandica TaxID=400682 RepID=A0A1X7SZ00_AMPQE|nr:PREDICTED: deoxynucleoside triphosphate triphosphohydrolase SAMHD1-like [Amphimedon queenslandica]|eukprot:XP_019862134.1 PREDICTED: deoxynucleoside triphosphate triphosphohydrolase SAMHD1-like [Amphimedon queenslandica]
MATPPVQSEPERFGTIMDPVHGSIQLDKYLFKIIDRPEFQRLRKIKQFGGVYYVYPGGVHTRFEHSIGVCYIAGQLVDALNKHNPPGEENLSKWFTPQEKMCVQIAALCHDIGHGPFSHVYDFAVKEYVYKKLKSEQKRKDFIRSKKDEYGDNEKLESYLEKNEVPKKAKHEYRSALIVKRLMEELNFDEFKEHSYMYIQLIQDMITFSERDLKNEETKEEFWPTKLPSDKTYKEKTFLFEIVANGFTGIDVDKMDYFARDAHSVGLPNNFDWRRFTQTAKIIKCEDDFHHICSRDKDALSLYELFHTRNVLYRSVYKHKTVVIVEHLMKKALKKTTPQTIIQVKAEDENESYSLLKCWHDIDAFLVIDDSIEDFIMNGQTDEHQQVQKLFIKKAQDTDKSLEKYFSRIKERKLPKFLGRTAKGSEISKRNIAICASAKKSEIETIEKRLKPLPVKFSYGKGSEDPIQSHYFYGKFYPQNPFHIQKEEVSKILPSDFKEEEVFWYYDMKDDNDDETEAVARSLWECLNMHKLPTEFKSALEGSCARKRKLHEVHKEYTEDEEFKDFQKIIKRYKPKGTQ